MKKRARKCRKRQREGGRTREGGPRDESPAFRIGLESIGPAEDR